MCPDCDITHSERECVGSLPRFFVVEHKGCPMGDRGNSLYYYNWPPGFGYWDRITGRLAPGCWRSLPQIERSSIAMGGLTWIENGGQYITSVMADIEVVMNLEGTLHVLP